jgi:tetratricopeptide (TPR) repeat protein
LNPEKRISKSQIKQDKRLRRSESRRIHPTELKTTLFIPSRVLLLIVAIIFFFNYLGNIKKSRGTELFGKAQLAGAMNQGSLAITDYRTILDNYGSTEVASKACFFIADIYNRQKNYDSAAVFYQKFVDNYNDDKILLRPHMRWR